MLHTYAVNRALSRENDDILLWRIYTETFRGKIAYAVKQSLKTNYFYYSQQKVATKITPFCLIFLVVSTSYIIFVVTNDWYRPCCLKFNFYYIIIIKIFNFSDITSFSCYSDAGMKNRSCLEEYKMSPEVQEYNTALK